MRKEVIAVTRNQIGLWASIIGGTGLLVGIIGLIWQGGVTPIVGGSLIAGAVGIAVWAYMTPKEFTGFITGRQARYSTMAVFATLLLLGSVALVYIVLQRAVLTLDMTVDKRFSISDETRQVLQRITRQIRITGFYSPNGLQLREVDDQFLRLYETATDGMITREYIDPEEQPALAQSYGVDFEGALFISYLNEDGSVDFSTLARIPRSSAQERDVTEAIARLLLSGTLKVYFEISHGELDPLDGTQQGLSGINNGIQESGLITAPLDLTALAASNGSIPADASAVILARPTSDLTQAEITVLDAYLQRGGGVFIMADVLFNENTFLRQGGLFSQYLWSNWGLRTLDAAVVDFTNSTQESPLEITSAAVFSENQIVARLDEETPTVFKVARPVEVNENPPANTPNGRLILSSEASYGETNLRALGETNTYTFDEGQDIRGPLTTAAWANNESTGGKIILVGDSDFVTNGMILSGGNSLVFTDGLSWLTGFSDRITFAPQAFNTIPLIFIDGPTLDLIAFVTVILLPGLALIGAILVWTRRLRAS